MGRRNERDEAGSAFARALAQMGGRPVKVVEFPGMPRTRVALWCPNQGEEADASAEASKRLTVHYKMSALDLTVAQARKLFDDEYRAEILTLVLRDPDEPEEAFFESSDEMRNVARPQALALMELVDDFMRERFMSRTPEQTDELMRLLREGKEAGVLSTWLASCESATELRFIIETLMGARPDSTPTPSTTSSSSNE